MLEVLQRLGVFTCGACVLAYGVYIVAGAAIQAHAKEQMKTVWVRDAISPNRHIMSGMVTVDSTCTELSVTPQQISPIAYELDFTTWEQPNVECEHEPTPRPFHTVVFAPAVGVEFIATLDTRPLPLLVSPTIE